MDVKPSFWERAARHNLAFRVTIILLAGLASAAAFLAGRGTTSAGAAILAGCAFAALWVLVLIALDRVEVARQRRYQGMGRIRDFAQRLVIYDRETGFYADWYFRLRLQEEIARSRRFGHSCTLILVESTRGRLGREGEKELFTTITDSFRSTDIIAHLGNLRFAVLLTNTSGEGASIARTRLTDRAEPGSLQIGMASFPADADNWRALVAAAGATAADLFSGAGQDWTADANDDPDDEPARTVA